MATPGRHSGPDAGFKIVPKRQLVEATDYSDDWTGLKDAKERRRIQNRLHQRAYRKRRAQAAARHHMGDNGEGRGEAISEDADLEDGGTDHPVLGALSSDYETNLQFAAAMGPGAVGHRHRLRLPADDPAWFPLTNDNKLLFVVAHNMVRGLLTNSFLIACLPRDVVFDPPRCPQTGTVYRKFSIPELINKPQHGRTRDIRLPGSLAPTALQAQVPHPPFMDILPCPKFRDNLLAGMAKKEINLVEFLLDLIGDSFGDPNSWLRQAVPADEAAKQAKQVLAPAGRRGIGMISWSDPWDVGGWEFTEKFARKWSFMFKGCHEVLAATNKWREIRGEEVLVFDTVDSH